jgi:hypothetical protein
MNPEGVKHELAEVVRHAQQTIEAIDRGARSPADDDGLTIDLGHILDHLCRAWNCRNLAPETIERLPEEQFDEFSDTVPNFQHRRKLLDFTH